MNSIPMSRRLAKRKGCRRNNRQKGGAGEAYTIGGPVTGQHVINNYDGEITRFASCEEAIRPGYLTNAPIKGGLPGFSGGARRHRRSRGRGRRTHRKMRGGRGDFTSAATQASAQWDVGSAQAGGRYTNEFNVVGDSKIALMEPSYSGCGDGLVAQQNQFNKGEISSLITAPPALVPTPTPGSGDFLQKGGRRRRSYQSGGVGGVDSMFYSAPRSGYTNWPSNAEGGNAGTLADGKTPFLLQVPFSAMPTPSQACIKTGGGRRMRKTKRSRKTRKTRKVNRR
jgi:hypothetical protein